MDPARDAPLRPLFLSAVALGLALLCAMAVAALGRPRDIDAMNVCLPAILLVVTTLAAAHLVARDPLAIWTPLPWFFLGSGIYFGLGALFNVLGSDNAIAFSQTYYTVTRDDLFRTHALNIVSLTVVTFVYLAVTALFPHRPLHGRILGPSARNRAMWIFAGVGIPAKFLLAIPYNMGLYRSPLPGFIGSIAGCSDIFLLILCYRAASGSIRAVPWAIAFAAVEFFVELLTFSKSLLLLTGLAIVLGVYLARPTLKTLAAGGLFFVGIYIVSVPFVSFARVAVHGGTAAGAGINDRASVTSEYFRRPIFSGSDDEQGWWIRINLANMQALAMTLYDSGSPGNSYGSAAYALIPRLLWPDKPVMSPGTEFNYLATGNDKSASSPGVFAEAYWNGGWPMVVVICAYLGALFAWFSRRARSAMLAKDVRWLPCGMYGILMVFPESMFVATYFSGIVVVLIYLLIMHVLVRDEWLRGTTEATTSGA